jgi:hypothetical protein
MIVSHEHRFIFVKTHKTGGTSVEIALSEHCGPDDIITPIVEEDEAYRTELGFRGPQHTQIPPASGITTPGATGELYHHVPASDIRRAVGEDVWSAYFKFTIVRNPYDQAVSLYWWGTRDRDPRPSITEYLLQLAPRHLSDWNIYAIADQVAVDHVARYEDLEGEITRIGRRIGVDLRLPAKRSKSQYRLDRRPYTEVLDQPARARIEEVCAHELAAFGYTWAGATQ